MARNNKGPGSLGAFIGGRISIPFWGAFGVLIAAAFLVLTPVNEVKRMPAEEDIKPEVYYIEGLRSGVDGAGWVAKRNSYIFEAPFEFTVNEQDLNQWSSASYGERRKQLMGEFGSTKIEPGIPIFRVAEDAIQVGFPVEISGISGISGISDKRHIIFQAAGTSESRQDLAFRSEPVSVYISSCCISNFQGLSSDCLRCPRQRHGGSG
jgi:hypothetical protein